MVDGCPATSLTPLIRGWGDVGVVGAAGGDRSEAGGADESGGRARLPGVSAVGAPAGSSLRVRGRCGARAAGTPAPGEPSPDPRRARGRDRHVAQGLGGPGSGCRCAHHRLPLACAPWPRTVGFNDLADLDPAWLRGPTATETTEELVHTVRGPDAQRAMAGRHHPLVARRWDRPRDLERARRSL